MENTKRLGRVLIDANIINYAIAFQKDDAFDWINKLYEKVYIHQTVLEELMLNKGIAEKYISEDSWILFNPKNDLSDDELAIYEMYIDMVDDGFKRLYEKKKAEGKTVKNKSNIGEIESIAAAMYLSANIICSNDYEVREVIEAEGLTVDLHAEGEVDDEIETLSLIVQDTVEDFCYFCVEHKVTSKKLVKKFFRVAHSGDDEEKLKRKLKKLTERLDKLS